MIVYVRYDVFVIVGECFSFGVSIWAGVLRHSINPDLLYCIFEFLICLPSREERGLQGILQLL